MTRVLALVFFSSTSNDLSARPIAFYGQRAPQRVRVPRVILVLVRRVLFSSENEAIYFFNLSVTPKWTQTG